MEKWQLVLAIFGAITLTIVSVRKIYINGIKPAWAWVKRWDEIFKEFIPKEDGSMKGQITTMQGQLVAMENNICSLKSILFSQIKLGNTAMIQCNGGGRCTEINKSWWVMTGMMKNESMGWGWLDAIHYEDKERVTKDWASAIIANTEFNFKSKFVNKMTDNVFDVEAVFVIDRNSSNEVVSIIGAFIKDIPVKIDKLKPE